MQDLVAIAEQIAKKLVANQQTVAVAESSAGGLISAALLAVPGASKYYLGGAVVYTRPARALLMDIPTDAMRGIRSSSEPYALLLAKQMRERLGNSYGDAAGHSCIGAVLNGSSGLREHVMTLETGSGDRFANMHAFASTALKFLLQQLSR
jgi:nicotinamide-nucleotide amidase